MSPILPSSPPVARLPAPSGLSVFVQGVPLDAGKTADGIAAGRGAPSPLALLAPCCLLGPLCAALWPPAPARPGERAVQRSYRQLHGAERDYARELRGRVLTEVLRHDAETITCEFDACWLPRTEVYSGMRPTRLERLAGYVSGRHRPTFFALSRAWQPVRAELHGLGARSVEAEGLTQPTQASTTVIAAIRLSAEVSCLDRAAFLAARPL